jgi:single-stranded-DNA-specific exonuclease
VGRVTERLDAYAAGFILGPRVNAGGRVGEAGLGARLLATDDAAEAAMLAARLDAFNTERRLIEQRVLAAAIEKVEREAAPAPLVFVADEGWHPGVIGIVAARVAETCDRPAALIAIEGEQGRGSARSFGDVRLHEALEGCAAHLLSHGGHAKAAGFTLPADRVAAFKDAFQAAVAAQGGGARGPRAVDAELPLDALTAPLLKEIELLEPFGPGNEEPLFCAFGVRAAGEPRRFGPAERQLAFYAATDRSSVRATAPVGLFPEEALGGTFDLAFFVRRREGGGEPVEIRVRELLPR